MKAVRIDTSGRVERIDLPDDRHERDVAIKVHTTSKRELWHSLSLKRDELMMFFGTDTEPNKVATKLARRSLTWKPEAVLGPVVILGMNSEGWETDISERMATKIVAMAPVITL